jgi:CheY-like chemotaxis protein
VDLEQLQSACDGDAGLMRELMDLYFGQADQIMAGLGKAIAAGDVREVDHLSHKLAGSSLACGMSALVPALRQLEHNAKAGHLQGAPDWFAQAARNWKPFADSCTIISTENFKNPRMKKILIVEDELVVRSIYRRKFEMSGYQVETAEEGAAALKLLPIFKPDLIQVDIMMPGMDGVEVIRQIRAWPEFRACRFWFVQLLSAGPGQGSLEGGGDQVRFQDGLHAQPGPGIGRAVAQRGGHRVYAQGSAPSRWPKEALNLPAPSRFDAADRYLPPTNPAAA